MQIQIADSWKHILQPEFKKPYFNKLALFVKQEYKQNSCFPDKENIFKAFDVCSLEALKVVLIGQDPYHGVGQADGLCFSVPDE